MAPVVVARQAMRGVALVANPANRQQHDVILQHDLLRRMLETHRGQPAPIGLGPGTSPAVDPVMPQQKPLQMLPRFGQHPPSRHSRPHQVAHCFVRGIEDPDRGQLAGAVQLASIIASRRSVLTRSPDFIGIGEGATTMQLRPQPVSKRCSP